MKIQFNSDDDLPLNKTIESTTITLVAILSFLLPIVFLRRMFMEFIKMWNFLIYSFMFQRNVYNMCYYLLMMYMNLSDISIFKVSDYHCIFS